MKIPAALKIMDAGWVRKKKGYRVYFESCIEGHCTPDTMPGRDEAPMASEVAAWRSAWKLAQSSVPDNEALAGAALVNITVVNDEDTPVPYYATGRYKIYHRRESKSENS